MSIERWIAIGVGTAVAHLIWFYVVELPGRINFAANTSKKMDTPVEDDLRSTQEQNVPVILARETQEPDDESQLEEARLEARIRQYSDDVRDLPVWKAFRRHDRAVHRLLHEIEIHKAMLSQALQARSAARAELERIFEEHADAARGPTRRPRDSQQGNQAPRNSAATTQSLAEVDEDYASSYDDADDGAEPASPRGGSVASTIPLTDGSGRNVNVEDIPPVQPRVTFNLGGGNAQDVESHDASTLTQ